MPRTPAQFEAIREDRKKAILDAALIVFAAEGYHSASISKVSKKAGISKGLMYNYFESKEALLQELLSSLIDAEMEVIRKIIEKPISKATFVKFIQLNIGILKKKPLQWKLYFSLSMQPEVLEVINARYQEERTTFGQLFYQFFVAEGHANPGLQLEYFFITYGGLKMRYILDPLNCPIEDLETLIIHQFIDQSYVSNSHSKPE